jgi:hypothetical protein
MQKQYSLRIATRIAMACGSISKEICQISRKSVWRFYKDLQLLRMLSVRLPQQLAIEATTMKSTRERAYRLPEIGGGRAVAVGA